MAAETTVRELQQTEFFQDIPEQFLDELADLCKAVEFPPKSIIFEEYSKAKEVYVVVSGEVSLAICEPDVSCRQIATVGPGELIGWSPLVGRPRLSDTAHTISAVRAYVFDGEKLLDYCRANPELGFAFMHKAACTLADRLSGTRLQLLKACGFDMPQVQLESD